MKLDPRVTPVRPDLAADGYARIAKAERYVAPDFCRVSASRSFLHRAPADDAPVDSELLFGEPFSVLETKDGWAWGQSGVDQYVGYVRAEALTEAKPGRMTHRVHALCSQIYPEPKLKTAPLKNLSFGSQLCVTEQSGGYARVGQDAWVPEQHLVRIDSPVRDWVAVAERFLGVPYVWGGRSSWGLDCSALVQLSRLTVMSGEPFPRDSDMQESLLGTALAPDARLQRGDLIFWKGHVGIMQDRDILLHANAHHMAVTTEPLAEAIERIEAAGDGKVTRRARLDAGLDNP